MQNQKRLVKERKARLLAENRCIDCKEPKEPEHVRCFKCRLGYRARESKRHTEHKRKPVCTVNPKFIVNAITLRDELLYDDGIEANLRQQLVNAINKWKTKVAA
jgi:hypothetical protein